MSSLASFYSTTGPLGVWTPVVAVLCNALGVLLALALTRAIGLLFAPSYDLYKVPSPPVADPILGHVKYLLRPDYHRVVLGWTRKFGSIVRFRLLSDWTVIVTDPVIAGQVLSNIPARTGNYTLVDEVLGGPGKISMFGTQDEGHWRNVRKATAPAFSMANVRRYYGGVLSATGELLGRLDAAAAEAAAAAAATRADGSGGGGGGGTGAFCGGGGGVAVEPQLQRLMLRATLEGLFEVPDATALPGFDRLAGDISLLMAEANAQIMNPLRALWYRHFPLAAHTSKHFAECRRAMRRTVAFHSATAARLLASPDPPADCSLLWACLHRMRHHATGGRLSPQELHPEVGMYTTAGFDTTTSTVGWCLYAASIYPDQQEAVAAELRQAGVFGPGAVVEEAAEEEEGGDKERPAGRAAASPRRRLRLDPGRCPGPEELSRLPRLNAFINEVMRVFPATAVSAERMSRDAPVRVGPYVLPPRTVVWPIVYGIHMSGANWEQPEAFRPERWLEDPRCAFARSDKAAAEAQPAATAAEAKASGPSAARAAAAAAAASAEGGAEEGAPRRFMPFGEGPKNCVGQNFGITVVRSVVALLLSRYSWTLHPDMRRQLAGSETGSGSGYGFGSVSLDDTARLTQVAVITKLRRPKLVPTRRRQV